MTIIYRKLSEECMDDFLIIIESLLNRMLANLLKQLPYLSLITSQPTPRPGVFLLLRTS